MKAKCEEIKHLIRTRINSGELAEGDRLPSEYELVAQMSVPRSQARQALRELEVEGYVVRRRGSGSYVAPNPGNGISLLPGYHRTVALALPTFDTRYIRHVVQGVMGQMFLEQYGVANYTLELDEQEELRFLDRVVENRAAGLLLWPTRETRSIQEALLNLKEKGVPFVLVDRHFPEVALDTVMSDNREIGARLTETLIEQGHRRIAAVKLALDDPSSQIERMRGFRQELSSAGIPADDSQILGLTSEAQLKQDLNNLLAQRYRPTAFFCINENVFRMVSAHVTSLGYTTPDEIAFATVDDGETDETPTTHAVTITQNGHEIGRQAAEVLLARMRSPDKPPEVRLVPPGHSVETIL